MKHIIVVALILLSAAMVTAEEAPSMWMEQDGNTINLMVNTSATEEGLNALVNFDPAWLNVTDVDVSMSPWVSLDGGPGWSHQGFNVKIALILFGGVAAGEYKVAELTMDCKQIGNTDVWITQAEPAGTVYDLVYVCDDAAPPVDAEDALISIGDATGTTSIPITISDAVSAGACDVTLSFDPDVVKVTGTSDGDMDCTYTNLENADAGWIRVGATQGSNSGVDTFTLLNVDLEPVVASGSCELTITVTTLKDDSPTGNEITYTVSNGTYSIEPAILIGDADSSGTVDILDGAYIANHLIGLTGYETIDEAKANVNGDNVLDMADSMYLTKYVMGEAGFETLG